MFIKGEINADNCYVSKYPYTWNTPDGKTINVCKFMRFEKNMAHDLENPYPSCIAKQKDVPFQLPKDRIIRDPQLCWFCYKLQKKEREQKLYKKATRYDGTIKFGHGPIYMGGT